MTHHIAFLGEPGSYSDLACRRAVPDYAAVPCPSFEDVIAAVHEGKADLAMLPIENSIAGRVADVHYLLPNSGLSIVAEHYQPVVHHLLGLPGSKLEDIRIVHSHVQALGQCRQWLRDHGIKSVVRSNTALAAAELSQTIKDPTIGVIASEVAGEIYGLNSLAADIADRKNNTTRFLVLTKSCNVPQAYDSPCITTLLFRVRSVPAALYKALGGFATNGVNITKLESYLVDGQFTAAQFYVDVEGNPVDTSLKNALEELAFFAHEVKIMGTYPASPFRNT
ncbi:MAG: prephenate dehydratase [Proteobacteria bacterium]|nr:prephenate dehydratase [Alphaproteobacteria bacterium]NCC02642.1 prephenate dehydratase [Pseudomonadota bacterium]